MKEKLSDSFKNENKHIEASDKNVKTLHKGKFIKRRCRKKIIEHIEFNRKLLNPVNVVSLIVKIIELLAERAK